MEAAHERLEGVVFENLPWGDVIERWESPGTLFYLDPPYWGGENDYGKDMFNRSDFERMAECLAGIKGAFIMSINDTPEIRQLFAAFDFDEVSLNYSVSKGQGKQARELILTNQADASRLL